MNATDARLSEHLVDGENFLTPSKARHVAVVVQPTDPPADGPGQAASLWLRCHLPFPIAERALWDVRSLDDLQGACGSDNDRLAQ